MVIKRVEDRPSNIIVGSARTCYNPSLIEPSQVEMWDKKDKLMMDLFKSGHYTTFMHSYISLTIEGISRALLWYILHNHTNYNSDQVSQRYTRTYDNFYYPPSLDRVFLKNHYKEILEKYDKLVEIIGGDKRAYEDARYILPHSMKANLYHTVNIITLLRYIALSNSLDYFNDEYRNFTENIENILIDEDVIFKDIISLVKKNKPSMKYIDLDKIERIKEGNVELLNVEQPLYYDTIENYIEPLKTSSVIRDVYGLSGFTVRMKISLAGDAQNQRHRTSYSVRPNLQKYVKTNSDYYIPSSIQKNEKALSIYRDVIERSINLVQQNSDNSDYLYLLPNAYQIEIVERSDYNNFIHKAQLRQCLNAQEEILKLHYEIVGKLEQYMNIDIFGPICVNRKKYGKHPFCTEGPRFCGIKMWDEKNYKSYYNS